MPVGGSISSCMEAWWNLDEASTGHGRGSLDSASTCFHFGNFHWLALASTLETSIEVHGSFHSTSKTSFVYFQNFQNLHFDFQNFHFDFHTFHFDFQKFHFDFLNFHFDFQNVHLGVKMVVLEPFQVQMEVLKSSGSFYSFTK